MAGSLNNLAALYRDQGHYAEAEPFYKRALAISEKALGPAHPNLAPTLNGLGVVFREMSRYDDAGAHFRRALNILETAVGSDHPNVAFVLNDLAGLLYPQQATFDGQCPLSCRFRLLYPQLRTWEAPPANVSG